MNFNWIFSKQVRHAGQMVKHVRKYVNAQRDILEPDAVARIDKSNANLEQSLKSGEKGEALKARMADLETTANKWLKPYPNAVWRENVEVLLVAIAVAMGIRTFILQPFKIPTGSMQPTLYGITSNPDFTRTFNVPNDLKPDPDFAVPNPLSRFILFWTRGIGYTHVVAKEDGAFKYADEAPTRFLLFNLKQRIQVGERSYTVWFPPDNMLRRSGLLTGLGPNPKVFRKGEDIIKLKVVSGDHLFVDRVTYNFRHPKRGEIIVFETRGISALPQDQFYIKRLVGLGDEHIRIGNDRHLIIGTNAPDGTTSWKRLDRTTPHFDKVYSFNPAEPPAESEYSGHVNDVVAAQISLRLAPLFPDESHSQYIPPKNYMVMGDNTVNSSDSRAWGHFAQENVIGRAFFVYWPFAAQNGRDSRFGYNKR
jgi:signal peptidase I